MRLLSLDFASPRGPWRRAGSIVCAVAVLVSALVVTAYAKLYMESSELATEVAHLRGKQERRNRPAPISDAQRELLKADLDEASGVNKKLQMPWGDLFRELEGALTDRVALLSIVPDPEKQELQVTAEAKDLDAMLVYENQVAQLPMLRRVHVSNHQLQQQDPLKPVHFVLIAQWLLSETATKDHANPIRARESVDRELYVEGHWIRSHKN